MAAVYAHCTFCGKLYVARDKRGKYCPDCRDAANKARKKETEHVLRISRKQDESKVQPHDTPEQIAMCLACKVKDCTGNCKAVSELKKKT